MKDEDAAIGSVPSELTLASRVLWLFGAAGIHLFLWTALFVLLYVYVPRQKSILDDFGVATSAATRGVIYLSDFVVNYGYLAAPLVTVGVMITDSMPVFLSRSTALRLACLVFLTIPPVVLLLASFVFPQHEVSVLMEGLR